MESVKSFIGVVFLAVFGITSILNVLYVVIGLFYELLRFCTKAIRKKGYQVSKLWEFPERGTASK